DLTFPCVGRFPPLLSVTRRVSPKFSGRCAVDDFPFRTAALISSAATTVAQTVAGSHVRFNQPPFGLSVRCREKFGDSGAWPQNIGSRVWSELSYKTL